MENFAVRHGPSDCTVEDGRLVLRAPDGAEARLSPPFDQAYDGPADAAAFASAVHAPECWGVLLVRKGGFAVARLSGSALVASKVGQRHVQGRTKAGGQSQQRFARRRQNQARQAYEAAAEHAHRVLVTDGEPVEALVCGGDRPAVEQVLADHRLRRLAEVRTGAWLPVPDPRRAVLDAAVEDAQAVQVLVSEGLPRGHSAEPAGIPQPGRPE